MERCYQPEWERMSQEEIKIHQSERLVAQVKHVYDNVPLYRERMDQAGIKPEDIKGIEDIGKLPFTSKIDLRDTYPYGMFAVPLKDVIRLHASSGTTGKQIVVGYTRKDLDIWADCAARQIVATGGSADDVIQISYGYGLFTGGLGIDGGALKLGAVTVPVSSGNTKRQVNILKDFGSTILCCTPSYAAFIGETMAEMGISPDEINLRAGIFGAEPWTEEMRADIERLLGIKAYDVYGLTEIMGPGVAYECSAQKGMHVNEDHFLIEVINPETGEAVPDGEKGEIVFSCLTKEAFPLLRFRTKDIGMITHERCSCGRTFVRMTKPMGRTDDMMIIRGVNVFPSQIEGVLMQRGYSSNYQIIVDREHNTDTFDVNIELNPEQADLEAAQVKKMEKELSAEIRTVLGIGADIHLVPPKSIERSQGKAVRVIDKRKLQG